MSKDRILWVDDSQAEFDRVHALWNDDQLQSRIGFKLEHLNLHELLNEDASKFSALMDDPPTVLVLDWNEGNAKDIYRGLKSKVSCTILVSWSRQDELRASGVFREFPELESTTLTKPFSAQQLAALVEKPHESRLMFSIRNFVRPQGFEEFLAIRYLNAELIPVGTSAGWRLDLNRPQLNYSGQQFKDLESGKPVRHNLFGSAPIEPEKFGPVQYVTQPLPAKAKGTWPESARYFQWGYALPEASEGIESFGRSVDGILALMREAGFVRGRYYHLTEVPGLISGPSLELVARYPDDPNRLPLPASREIDRSERADFEEYCHEYDTVLQTRETTLVSKVREVDGTGSDGNDEFWSRYVDDGAISNRLEVPVFLTKREAEKSAAHDGDILRNVRGMFVFDRGNHEPIEVRHVRAVERSLLSALNYFGEARLLERERFEQARALQLLSFHERLGKLGEGPNIEQELIHMAVHVVGLDTHGGVTERTPGERSAMYVRFDSVHQSLDVSCETQSAMAGFSISLDQDCFVLVRCAKRALQAKAGENPVPVFLPDLEDLPETERIREEDWLSIPQCTAERMRQCSKWLKDSVKTVVAFPVMSGSQLLGVLVLRSNRAHEFTRRRVQAVNRVIDIALPYLERLRNEANRKTWDGLVMHEMRANLTWAKAKADRLATVQSPAETAQVVKDLLFVLQDGQSLSTQFLHWLGFTEQEDEVPTNGLFWVQLNEYGDFRSRSSERLLWTFQYEGDGQGVDAVRLGRAIRVLIDNAFRYADYSANTVRCTVKHATDSQQLIVSVVNPGRLLEHHPRPELDSQAPSIGSLPRALKAEVGLTLVKLLCRDVSAQLVLHCEELVPGKPEVVATLEWPIAVS